MVLSDASGAAQVVVAPEYQGRVMTSTTGGPDAPSFGWIGRGAIAARQRQPHINVFGGEDRFWLGPEGGQFSLYFKKGDPFDLDHWQVPDAIDWGKWDVDSQSASAVRFRKRMSLANYTGTPFDIEVDRTIRLLAAEDFARHLGEPLGSDVRMVAFESSNTVTNAGSEPWQPASGLVSVWILGHVYAVSRHDDCDSIRRRPGVDARARRERRIFRKSAGRSAARDESPSSSFAATGSIAARLGSHRRARARWPAATMGSGAS